MSSVARGVKGLNSDPSARPNRAFGKEAQECPGVSAVLGGLGG